MSAALDPFADLDRLRLPATPVPTAPKLSGPPVTPKPKRMTGEFLKGPIPLPWLTAASKLAGKGPLAVALAVWFEAGRRKSQEVRLTTAILQRFNVNRKAKYRALRSLEKAGLVRVRRERRKNPVVTILECQRSPDDGGGGQEGTGHTPGGETGVTSATPLVAQD
jgi:hypothetical protein